MKVNDRVKCGVYVCGEFRATYTGVIVEDMNGYYRVDIGSLHGGKPWIVNQEYSHLIPDELKSKNSTALLASKSHGS